MPTSNWATRRTHAGAQHYKATGEALPSRTLEAARNADAILFGAMGWPEIRYPDGTEIAPQLDLRFALELYAGVCARRARSPACRCRWPTRARATSIWSSCAKSTEGLFASRGKGTINADDTEARDTMVITRAGSERVHDFSFRAGPAPQATARHAGARDLRRQGQRVRLDGLLPQDIRRARGAFPPTSKRAITTSTRPRSTWSESPGSST